MCPMEICIRWTFPRKLVLHYALAFYTIAHYHLALCNFNIWDRKHGCFGIWHSSLLAHECFATWNWQLSISTLWNCHIGQNFEFHDQQSPSPAFLWVIMCFDTLVSFCRDSFHSCTFNRLSSGYICLYLYMIKELTLYLN